MTKHFHLYLTIFFFSLLSSNALIAQVDTPPNIKYCHHATHDVEKRILTDAEKSLMVASMERSDTFDILHIAVNLEIINFISETINGYTDISFSPKMEDISVLLLDLRSLDIDSILLNGEPVTFDYNDFTINVNLPSPFDIGETAVIRVYYNGHPATDSGGFGGLDFNNGYAYNLGIGITSNPYNYGSGWFPCFDNFVERQTFEFNIKTSNSRRAYCTGTFLGQTNVGGDTIMRSYYLDQPIPTYLAGVAVSYYEEVNQIYETANGPLPIQLVANGGDTTAMKNTFVDLGACVDAIESWYGPYQWERVGYVATPNGAMEHPTNIAYPVFTALNGNTAGHKRLMAHELAHCWWGDIVTLSSAANMWIKEGNAEYGAHLFTLHLDGQEAFLNQVKTNFIQVLKTAHYDDDSYLPLSGLPYEYTYGTHTYFKGASMLHNLRGYLGDELFSAAQTDVLETFAYSAIDAEMYRDHLTEFTGIDMTSFFQDWIFSPGYAGYEFNTLDYSSVSGGYQVDMTIEQKLRGAPAFHTNTPIDVTCVDENFNRYTEQVMVSGASSDVTITAPFEPVATFLNGDHKLNIANIAEENIFTEPDTYSFLHADFEAIVENVPSDTWMRVEHCWIPPDGIQNPAPGTRISNTHYWKVDADLPEGFLAKGIFNYRGPAIPELDKDLLQFGEDSILLVYRKDASEEWQAAVPQEKVIFLPTDGEGYIRADSLIPGEYAFAVGMFDGMVPTNEINIDSKVSVFPNPTIDIVTVSGTSSELTSLNYSISDISGKEIVTKSIGQINNEWSFEVNMSDYPNGIYVLEINNDAGQLLSQQKLTKSAP